MCGDTLRPHPDHPAAISCGFCGLITLPR